MFLIIKSNQVHYPLLRLIFLMGQERYGDYDDDNSSTAIRNGLLLSNHLKSEKRNNLDNNPLNIKIP
jgi:hypothetical protein